MHSVMTPAGDYLLGLSRGRFFFLKIHEQPLTFPFGKQRGEILMVFQCLGQFRLRLYHRVVHGPGRFSRPPLHQTILQGAVQPCNRTDDGFIEVPEYPGLARVLDRPESPRPSNISEFSAGFFRFFMRRLPFLGIVIIFFNI